jgi:radical SAM protein with 4Fe4S-binding SPASM domain
MCQLSRKNPFDIREERFARGWDEHFPKLRERKWQTNAVCRSCNLLSLCSNCSGAAEMETGDVEGIVPAFCEMAHLRAWEAMGEGSGHARDASCCLGRAVAAARAVAAGPLIQIQRRRPPAAPAA